MASVPERLDVIFTHPFIKVTIMTPRKEEYDALV